MTDQEQELNQAQSGDEPGRARQRKLKREQAPSLFPLPAIATNRHMTDRARAKNKSGPSDREQQAASQIKLPIPTMNSIGEKLAASLDYSSKMTSVDKAVTKIPLVGRLFAAHTPHRKAESRRSGYKPPHEVAQRSETQHFTSTETEFRPRKGHKSGDPSSGYTPPVMVRGGLGGMAFGRSAASRVQKQKSPRRRFDVALNVPGAEVRLPSLPFAQIGSRSVSLLMAVMMIICLFLMWKAPVFMVNTIDTAGLKRLTATDLNTVMGTYGKSIFTLNPNQIEKILHQAFPELSKISVRINLPAKVKVVVNEREPVISWTEDNTEAWVDVEGVSFPPRGTPANTLVRVEGYGTPPSTQASVQAQAETGLPVSPTTFATPGIPTIQLPADLVSAILALSAKMPADTVLVYDSEHGLGWNDPNGWEVFFGAEDADMEMKLSVYQTLVDRLKSEGIQPALISVEYVHAPYYRMER
jgi:cell division protein FtsQ